MKSERSVDDSRFGDRFSLDVDMPVFRQGFQAQSSYTSYKPLMAYNLVPDQRKLFSKASKTPLDLFGDFLNSVPASSFQRESVRSTSVNGNAIGSVSNQRNVSDQGLFGNPNLSYRSQLNSFVDPERLVRSFNSQIAPSTRRGVLEEYLDEDSVIDSARGSESSSGYGDEYDDAEPGFGKNDSVYSEDEDLGYGDSADTSMDPVAKKVILDKLALDKEESVYKEQEKFLQMADGVVAPSQAGFNIRTIGLLMGRSFGSVGMNTEIEIKENGEKKKYTVRELLEKGKDGKPKFMSLPKEEMKKVNDALQSKMNSRSWTSGGVFGLIQTGMVALSVVAMFVGGPIGIAIGAVGMAMFGASIIHNIVQIVRQKKSNVGDSFKEAKDNIVSKGRALEERKATMDRKFNLKAQDLGIEPSMEDLGLPSIEGMNKRFGGKGLQVENESIVAKRDDILIEPRGRDRLSPLGGRNKKSMPDSQVRNVVSSYESGSRLSDVPIRPRINQKKTHPEIAIRSDSFENSSKSYGRSPLFRNSVVEELGGYANSSLEGKRSDVGEIASAFSVRNGKGFLSKPNAVPETNDLPNRNRSGAYDSIGSKEPSSRRSSPRSSDSWLDREKRVKNIRGENAFERG